LGCIDLVLLRAGLPDWATDRSGELLLLLLLLLGRNTNFRGACSLSKVFIRASSAFSFMSASSCNITFFISNL